MCTQLFIGKRGFSYYKNEIISGEILSVMHGMVEIYPDGETGSRDECSFMFPVDDVILFDTNQRVAEPVNAGSR